MRLHASSGTRGKPTVVGYTKADLDTWTDLMARCMTMAGVRPGMLVHNANGYGLFTGGLGFHQGGERIGATVVPVSGGFNSRQAMLLCDLGAQVLVSTPSYALVIAQALADAGVDPAQTPLELGLFGGEPWTDALRTQIDRTLGIKSVNFYGLSEMCGPGVATECLTAREGLHVNEDHFIVEVIDPGQRHPGRAGQRRRAGVHHADQGGAAADPLPDRRPRRDHPGALPVRSHDSPPDEALGPARRHGDRPRRQRLPVARRAPAA